MLEVFITNLANKEHNKIQQTKTVVRERETEKDRERDGKGSVEGERATRRMDGAFLISKPCMDFCRVCI